MPFEIAKPTDPLHGIGRSVQLLKELFSTKSIDLVDRKLMFKSSPFERLRITANRVDAVELDRRGFTRHVVQPIACNGPCDL